MNRRQFSTAMIAVATVALLGTAVLEQGSRIAAGNAGKDSATGTSDQNTRDRPRVVIAGAGISGLCAALELGRGGAEVTVVDMSSVFGGHAVMSQGGVSVIDTPIQRESGIEDSPDMAYDDFIAWGEDADADWVRYYVDHSRADIYEWLTEFGVRFESVLRAPGNSVDRFHQPAGRGIGLVTPIYRACLDHDNIRFVWNAQAIRMLSDNGRVGGIRVRHLRDDTESDFHGDAVILATGGFQSNLQMVREFWPQEFTFPERILAGSGRNSVGYGHKLALGVGAALKHMDHQWNYFTGIPDPRLPDSDRGLSAANMHGIIVNPDGKRFANLHNWAREVMPPMLRQKNVTTWFIFDEACKREFTVSGSDWADFRKVERLILDNPSLVKKADSVRELATLSGLPPDALEATIRRYNTLVDQGRDTDFHRFGPDQSRYSNEASPRIDTPPFYAMQAWPLTRKSMGGVAIDLQCRVVDKNNVKIPGLYAVGELTGLAGINGKAALEGTFLGPCIVTGRVAARSILGVETALVPGVVRHGDRCVSCHDVEALLDEPRSGYWHFEQSHRLVVDREINCLQCHAELAPYREKHHRMDALALTDTCRQCHIAQE